jgi:hypothetical protein
MRSYGKEESEIDYSKACAVLYYIVEKELRLELIGTEYEWVVVTGHQ